ncbi:ParB N-terminal domain-containing protein [Ruegeria sp. Alg231-54]|uniref:ParB/RepB/Spo0J family partition protein n=1 Tax=Ruegeria sp. Alg231-54 TaxID=1922221 RepID=UPI000D552D7A|nr:ParB N-terminal domain-containing protein [Ruegeria sp. Alg231-54]
MAKRKRLTPARLDYLKASSEVRSVSPDRNPAPIAQMAGEAAATAALQEVSQALQNARADRRMIELLPLAEIDGHHLVRDRLEQNEEEMGALVASLRLRGQQMPVEVVALPTPVGGCSYGLISGWRRLTALRRLFKETGDSEFEHIRAMVITPDTAQDAYLAMVEENEIRVNLSHYERARIAVQAMKEGVYPTQKAALQGLFGNAARSKRSKIGSFIALVESFDAALWFPSAISEKLGLALVREMGRDPGFADSLKERLCKTPRESAEAEMQILSLALEGPQDRTDPKPPMPRRLRSPGPSATPGEQIVTSVSEGIELRFTPGQCRIELVGEAVSDRLAEALQDWLQSR